MSAPRFTTDQKDEILSAYIAGEKIASIAKRMGCDQSYPAHLARRRGAVRPPANKAKSSTTAVRA